MRDRGNWRLTWAIGMMPGARSRRALARRLSSGGLLGAVLLASFGCSPAGRSPETATLTISAAASLQPVLTELQGSYVQTQPQIELKLNFGASGALKQQILQGAPIDLFIAADQPTMTELAAAGAIDPRTRQNLVANTLVLVARPGSPVRGWGDLANPAVKFVAIGDPETVPAGRYGMATLKTLNLWQVLQPKLVRGQDVRQVLAYTATGNADAGIVYATDGRQNAAVQTVAIAPPQSHPPILYPMAVLSRAHHPAAARAFGRFLQEPGARSVFRRYGFRPIETP